MVYPYRKLIKPPLGSRPIKGHSLGPAGGLVGCWLMNEGAGGEIYDLSHNWSIGTLRPEVSWSSGKYGPALLCPANQGYVTTGSNIYDMGIRRHATFVIWFNPINLTNYRYLFSDYNTLKGISVYLTVTTGVPVFYVYPNNHRITGSTACVVGKDQMIVAVMDGANMYLYLDGKQIGTTTLDEDIGNSASPFRIGVRGDLDSSTSRSAGSHITQVLNYNRVLSASEIALLNREPFVMFDRGLIELWPGNGVSSNLTVEVSDSIGLIGTINTLFSLYEVFVNDTVGLISNDTVTQITAAYTVFVTDTIGLIGSDEARLDLFEIFVNDTVGLLGTDTAALNLFEIFVNDAIGLISSDNLLFDKYNIQVSDSIGTIGAVIYAPKFLLVNALDGIGLTGSISEQVGSWLGLDATNLISGGAGTAFCGEDVGHLISDGLNNENTLFWGHVTDHQHYFILDLGAQYNITKFRGASFVVALDPSLIDIFISTDGLTWGNAVASAVSVWEDTDTWVEVDSTDKIGRYIKVEINDTEDANNALGWGSNIGMIDAYGYVQVASLTFEVNDTIGVSDVVFLEIPVLEVSSSDTIGTDTSVTTLYPLLEINVNDTIGLTDVVHVHQAMKIFVSDAIGVTEDIDTFYSLYEVYVSDTINVGEWYRYIIPGAEVVQIADIFRFPQIPTDSSDELRRFFYELENDLRALLTGDVHHSGTMNSPTGNIGDINNRITIDKRGVTKFIGRAGIPTADIYVEDIDVALDMAAEDTYYQTIPWSTNSAGVNGASIDAVPDVTNDHITIQTAGLYRVNWHVACYSGEKTEFKFEVFKNNGNTGFPQTENYRTTGTADAVGSVSGGGNCFFNAGDTVELWAERKDGAGVSKTITIRTASLRLTMLGGIQ